MKNIKLFTFSLVLCGIGIGTNVYSQCRTDAENVGRPFYEVETECAKANSESSYLSDGKDYRSLLTNNNSEFVVLFYADNKYRVAACTDVGGPLTFYVRDHLGNTLFTNASYENAPYWDLVFPTTVECIVTISLPDETRELAFGNAAPAEAAETAPADSGAAEEGGEEAAEEGKSAPKAKKIKPVCAVLVIGYKQE